MRMIFNLFETPSVGDQIIIIALTATLGLMIGKLKLKGIGLGAAGALFVGILLGHLGFRIDSRVLHFVQEFGLILFVYTIGMQVGPGFVDSMRRHGLVLNVLAFILIFSGVLVTLALFFFTDMHDNVPVLLGMLCGAVTNTPALGALNSAFVLAGVDSSVTGIGYAVAYPFGVIGIILVMILVKVIFKRNPQKAAEEYREEIALATKEIESCSFAITNPNIIGLPIKNIPHLVSTGVVVTRLWRNDNIITPDEETTLLEGDKIHLVGMPEDLICMERIIGKKLNKPITQQKVENSIHPIISRTILVTNKKMLGKTIGSLSFAKRYGVNVSRVTRSGFKFTGNLNLRLKFADKLLVVGDKHGVESVEKELGNSLIAFEHPEILPAFLGILLGVIFGSIPISIPGIPTPLKLGLAGGPLIVSIILSRKRKIGPLNFFMANGANLMLREFGLTLFLSCVGLNAGIKFFDVLLNGDGLYYMGLSAIITLVPLIIVALLGLFVFKINYLTLCGVLAGANTDPPALSFANELADSEASNIAYTSVYPMSMLLRILTSQILAIILLQLT